MQRNEPQQIIPGHYEYLPASKPGLAGAHLVRYAHRKKALATVFNDNSAITVGQ